MVKTQDNAVTEKETVPAAIVDKVSKEEESKDKSNDTEENNATESKNNANEEGDKKEKREKNNRRREPKVVNSRAALFGDAPASTGGTSGRDSIRNGNAISLNLAVEDHHP